MLFQKNLIFSIKRDVELRVLESKILNTVKSEKFEELRLYKTKELFRKFIVILSLKYEKIDK